MVSQRIIANINPVALVWVRQVIGMPLEVAAKKIGVSINKLKAFEVGEAAPTIRQLLNIARVYRKPTAFFYLINLPEKPEKLHDYRRLPEVDIPPSPALIDAVLRAKERRLDAIELSLMLDIEIPAFELTANQAIDPSDLAAQIRNLLAISMEQQQSWRDQYHALRSWIAAAESKGVLVFQFSNVGLEDARGFSIVNHPLPIVAINGKDWPRAKIFTLIHEIAHIALDASGICDLHVVDEEDRSIEIYCNEVAGEVLVPKYYLLRESFVRKHRSSSWKDEELQYLSEHFSVSYEVVLRRLLNLGYTTMEFYKSKRREIISEAIAARERRGGFLSPTRRILRDNGRAFSSLVRQAYNSDLITDLEVSRLLGGAKLKHVDVIFGEI
jgi:Zn-dependent peptidase ImmA (M78 family)